MAQAVWMFVIQGFGNLGPVEIGVSLVPAMQRIAIAYLGAFFGR